MTLLSLRDVQAYYGPAQILAGITLDVAPGEVVALLGRNGAGKSTTFRTIMGLVAKRDGAIHFSNTDIMGKATHEIARLGIGYVPEDRRIFTELTVMENLSVGRRPPQAGLTPWSPERLFDLFPNLAAMRDRPGGRMSGGEQQMLTIARTLMGNPSLVLLDEPSEGLAPLIVEHMVLAILALKREGLAMLVSEQNLHFARLICDRAYIIERGRMRFSGTMTELQEKAEIRDATLAF